MAITYLPQPPRREEDAFERKRWFDEIWQRIGRAGGLLASTIGAFDWLTFNTSATGVPTTEGTLSWSATDHTLNVQSEIADSVLQVGQENWIRAVNKTGSTIVDGKAVYISGAQGNRPKISLAKANAEATSYTIGVTTANISNNAEGYVTVLGLVRGFNTSSFTEGDPLWLSATTAGSLTNIPPPAPNHATFVGYALNSTNNGTIFVNPAIGYELGELHDVLIGAKSEGQLLKYDNTNKYWGNTQNITINDATPTITTNTNDLVINCGTEKTLRLEETVWDDIIIPLIARSTGVGNPDFAGWGVSGTLRAFLFDAGIIESIYGTFEMPHTYEEGTDLDVHVHWTPTTALGGNVVWGLEYSIMNIDGTFPAPTTATSTEAAGNTNWKHIYSDVVLISGVGRKLGAVCNFRLFRDASNAADTYAGDAALISFGVHIRHDTLGSRTELAK